MRRGSSISDRPVHGVGQPRRTDGGVWSQSRIGDPEAALEALAKKRTTGDPVARFVWWFPRILDRTRFHGHFARRERFPGKMVVGRVLHF